MSQWSYLFLEVSTLGLFVLTLWHAARRSRAVLVELLSALVYGIVLEWGVMLHFQTYSYSSHFWFTLGPVPLTIGLCWGLIIYGAMAYTDQLGLSRSVAPFADALLAILLDFAFDAVAIRLRLWTWNIPFDAGYFGVPADNFWAWLFVAFTFSAYTRLVRQTRGTTLGYLRQSGAPLVAFAGLVASIYAFKALAAGLYENRLLAGGGLPIFGAAVLGFVAVVVTSIRHNGIRTKTGIDLIPTLTRWAMHGYFGLWALGLTLFPALRLPGVDFPLPLVLIAFGLVLVEALLLVPMLQHGTSVLRQIHILPPYEHRQMERVKIGSL